MSYWVPRDGWFVASDEVVDEVLAGRWVWIGDVCIGSDQDRYVGIVKDGKSQYACPWGADRRAAAEQVVERAKPRNAMLRQLPIVNEPIAEDGRPVREHVNGFIRNATTPHARVVANELMRLIHDEVTWRPKLAELQARLSAAQQTLGGVP